MNSLSALLKDRRFAALCLGLGVLCAMPARAGAAEDPHAADRAALRELAAAYEKAAATGDAATLEPFLAPDFTAVMLSGEEVAGADGLRAYRAKVKERLAGGTLSVKVRPEPAQFEGDLALCRGATEETATTGDGKVFAFASRFTVVARKMEGKWRIVRLQAGINPVENCFTAAAVKGATTLGLLAGAVGGLLAGLLAGWWFGGRRKKA